MLEQLLSVRADLRFDITQVDIDSTPHLQERFGLLIPVLMHGEHELARYRLDSMKLRAYLAQAQ